MTKAELLAALATKYSGGVVGTPVERANSNGVRTYQVDVLDVSGDVATGGTVLFYVVDEGGAGESAYWKQREPKPSPGPESFASKIHSRIAQAISAQAQVGGQTLHAVFDVEIDSRNERARMTIVTHDGGSPPTYITRTLIAWLNESDQLQHSLLS